MIESLRDIGYSFPAAIADIVDNAITAGARTIEILDNSDAERPAIAILDDGCGMSEDELREAMRPGTTNPREERATRDLGPVWAWSEDSLLLSVSAADCRDPQGPGSLGPAVGPGHRRCGGRVAARDAGRHP